MPAAGKDYKRRSSMPRKKPVAGYIWLLAGLIIGLFVAFLVYLDKQPKETMSFTEAVTTELDKVKNLRNDSSKNEHDSKNKPVKKEPEFSFYTILPELEVLINDFEIKPEKPIANTSNLKNTKESTAQKYILQAGSFRNYDDANTLKANLALLGVESSIQSVNIKNESWHRVRIGPFNNTTNLHGTRKILQQNNIKTMTMELK